MFLIRSECDLLEVDPMGSSIPALLMTINSSNSLGSIGSIALATTSLLFSGLARSIRIEYLWGADLENSRIYSLWPGTVHKVHAPDLSSHW
jgi:hypothetical protein